MTSANGKRSPLCVRSICRRTARSGSAPSEAVTKIKAAQSGSRMCVDMLSPSDPTSALAGAAEVENSDSILRGYSGGPQFGGPAADKPGRPASERATKIALIPVPEDRQGHSASKGTNAARAGRRGDRVRAALLRLLTSGSCMTRSADAAWFRPLLGLSPHQRRILLIIFMWPNVQKSLTILAKSCAPIRRPPVRVLFTKENDSAEFLDPTGTIARQCNHRAGQGNFDLDRP
jgi:hypothetical protein